MQDCDIPASALPGSVRIGYEWEERHENEQTPPMEFVAPQAKGRRIPLSGCLDSRKKARFLVHSKSRKRITRKEKERRNSGSLSLLPFELLECIFYSQEFACDRMALAGTCKRMWRAFKSLRNPSYLLKRERFVHFNGWNGYRMACKLLQCEGVFSRLVAAKFVNVHGPDGSPIDMASLPQFRSLHYEGVVFAEGLDSALRRKSMHQIVLADLDNLGEEYCFDGKWKCDELMFRRPIPSNLWPFANVRKVYLDNSYDEDFSSVDVCPLRECELVSLNNLSVHNFEKLAHVHTLDVDQCKIRNMDGRVRFQAHELFLSWTDFFLADGSEEDSEEDGKYTRVSMSWFPNLRALSMSNQVGFTDAHSMHSMQKLEKLKLCNVAKLSMCQLEVCCALRTLRQLSLVDMDYITHLPQRISRSIKLMQLDRLTSLVDILPALHVDVLQLKGLESLDQEQLLLVSRMQSTP